MKKFFIKRLTTINKEQNVQGHNLSQNTFTVLAKLMDIKISIFFHFIWLLKYFFN